MFKKVIVPGLLGGIVFIFWTFIVNGVFGFKSSMDMKTIPNEDQVYEILKENIIEPGRYGCNPQVTPNGFPDNEPAFSVLYGGVGHEAAGWLMLVQLPLFFFAPVLGTLMLSFTSKQILRSYIRRVLFFTGIGLLIALFSDLMNFGIGNYPSKDAIILALHDIVVWTVIGLMVAWRMKPEPNLETNL
jgi:hypothetical protein